MVKASPEFMLLAALARPRRDDVWRTHVRDLAAWVDWPRFPVMVARHRMWGLAHVALSEAGVTPPHAIAARLRESALECARRSLEQAALAQRLQSRLDAAGVANLILKGPPLEQLAYGALGRRGAFDIDILVAPADATAAAHLLLAEGCAFAQDDPADLAAFESWMAYSKECAFRHGPSGHIIELHWRPLDRLDSEPAPASRQVCVAPGLELRALADAPQLAYLCAHGASHAWRRLKWLADLAHWLSRAPAADAQAWIAAGLDGPDRAAVLSGLVLAKRWLGLETSHPAPSTRVRAFIGLCEDLMAADPEDARETGTLIQAAQLLLPSTPTGLWREARRQSVSIADHRRLRLKPGWRWLYPLIRGPSWLLRRVPSLRRP